MTPSRSNRPRSRSVALLAPRWEVDTARAQTNRGEPDAGLSVEERAAKAGLGNILANPGSFTVVGLDLNQRSQKCQLGARLRIKSGSSPHGMCAMCYERCSKKSGAPNANGRASSNQIDHEAVNEVLWEQAA